MYKYIVKVCDITQSYEGYPTEYISGKFEKWIDAYDFAIHQKTTNNEVGIYELKATVELDLRVNLL